MICWIGNKLKHDYVMLLVQAEFTAENKLLLRNASETAQFTNLGSGRSGIYPVSYFTNTSVGSPFVSASSGKWLDGPQATLYGSSGPGNQSLVLLTLSSPQYDIATEVRTKLFHMHRCI